MPTCCTYFYYTDFYACMIDFLKRERGYTVLSLSVLPSVQDIFRRNFLSNYWWQKSDIWSQASYRYAILWEAFLDPSNSYFLFADLVGFSSQFILPTYSNRIKWFLASKFLLQVWYKVPPSPTLGFKYYLEHVMAFLFLSGIKL